MFNDDELNDLKMRYSAYQAASGANQKQAPVATKAPAKKKNFLTSLISEAGGAGGAVGGAAIGTALLPGVGTILGAGIGGFLGGTGGRVVENKVRDNRIGLGDALTEGALSGIAGGSPGKLIKAVKTAKGAIQAGKTGTTTLEQALVPDAPLKTSLSGKLDAFGDKQLSKGWGVLDSPTRRMTDPAKTIPQLFDIGVTKKVDADRIANGFTGTDGLVNKAVINAVGDKTPVSIGNVGQLVPDSIINRNLSGLPQEKTATAFIKAQLTKLGETPTSSSVMQTIKRLEKQARDLEGAGGNFKRADPTRGDVADVYRDVAKHLEGTVYKDADKNLSKVLTPELRKGLIDLQPNNPAWTKYVDEKVMGAKSVKDLRGAQSPFVKARQMVDNAADNEFSASGQMANSANGIRGALVDGIANIVKKPVDQLAGVTAKKVAPMLPGGVDKGLAGALSTSTKGILTREAIASPLKTGLTTTAPVEAAGLDEGLDSQQQSTAPTYDDLFGTQEETAPESASPYSLDNLKADMARDPKNSAKYLDYYKEVQAVFEPEAGEDKLSATVGASLASSSNGINTLEQLEGLYGSAGGGDGKVVGGVKNLLGRGGLNGNVQTYNDLSASSVSQLAKALNGGGQVSDTDALVIVKALPRITDSPEVARAKFTALKERLANARQNTLTYGASTADPSTLTGALQ